MSRFHFGQVNHLVPSRSSELFAQVAGELLILSIATVRLCQHASPGVSMSNGAPRFIT